MAYATKHGRVLTWALEARVVDHCNLRCEHCCTMSPFLPPRSTDPEKFREDLEKLAPALAPGVFRVSGGEPLLHPDIVACVAAVRASHISDVVSLTTNGFLLSRAPAALWQSLDRITLSWYSDAPLAETQLSRIEDLCRQHDVMLTIKPASSFQAMTTDAEQAPDRVQAIFDDCWLKVRCHLVQEGRFYCCTRPPHLGQAGDGIGLDGPELRERLRQYLEREAPLTSCQRCLEAGEPGSRTAS